MQRILKIAQREYIETIKTKTFILSVLMAPLIIGLIIFFTKQSSRGIKSVQPVFKVDITDFSGELNQEIQSALVEYNQRHQKNKIKFNNIPDLTDAEKAKQQGQLRLAQGKSRAYAVLNADIISGHGKIMLYTYKPKASDLGSMGAVEHILRQAIINKRCQVQKIPKAVLNTIRYVPIDTIEVSKNSQRIQKKSDKIMTMMLPFFFMYLMFMGMMGTGQQMLSSVIEEKNSRVIEVLLSAVTPFQLMAGKIMGLAGIGLSVVIIWGSSAFFAAQYKGFDIVITPEMCVYFLIYFLLGFVFFTSLLAGVGSVCNTIKETQGLMMPLMFIFIIPLLSWMRFIQEPNGLLARVLSFVPPITPMVMMLRIVACPDISRFEIIASIIVLAGGVWLMIWCSARVFRAGILMYGKRPGLREIGRWLR